MPADGVAVQVAKVTVGTYPLRASGDLGQKDAQELDQGWKLIRESVDEGGRQRRHRVTQRTCDGATMRHGGGAWRCSQRRRLRRSRETSSLVSAGSLPTGWTSRNGPQQLASTE
eukprot:5518171-Amphidinium_carterae.2